MAGGEVRTPDAPVLALQIRDEGVDAAIKDG